MFAQAIQGLSVQQRVVKAVLLREVRTRFGNYYLGYLWAVIVPLLFVLTMTVLFGFIGRRAAHGAPMEVLLFSGLMAWLTFADTQTNVSRAYDTNRPLLAYPMVSVADIAIARTLLEFATKVCATIVLCFILMAAGVEIVPDDYLAIAFTMGTMAYMGAVYGHLVGCILVFAPSFNFVMTSTRRLLFFTSGVLFLLSDIPEEWRYYLLFNPIAHVLDMARGAWIVSYSAPYGDPYYVAAWAIGLTGAAAIGEVVVRRRRSGAMR